MSNIDFALIEPYNLNHYQHVPIFICKLLSKSNINVGFVDYCNTYEKEKSCTVLSPRYIYLPKRSFPNNLFNDFTYLYKLRKFHINLLKYTYKYTQNILFTTYSPILFSSKYAKNQTYILYIHNLDVMNIGFGKSYSEKILAQYLKNKIFKRTTAIITNEKAIKNQLIDYGINKPIYIIPWLSNIHLNTFKNITDSVINNYPDEFRILFIGEIRKEKNIEFLIENIAKTNYPLTVAGKPSDEYGKRIANKYKNKRLKNINFLFKHIPNDQYLEFIKSHSFVIITRGNEHGSYSSGPMLDALLLRRPIIAPNIYPFNYYIEKYDIGILYETNNRQSLIKAISKVQELGPQHYKKNIDEFVKKNYDNNILSKRMEMIIKEHFNV